MQWSKIIPNTDSRGYCIPLFTSLPIPLPPFFPQDLIELTRELLDTDVTALSLESYQRAYPTMVCVQMLAELEEVMEYKLHTERQASEIQRQTGPRMTMILLSWPGTAQVNSQE